MAKIAAMRAAAEALSAEQQESHVGMSGSAPPILGGQSVVRGALQTAPALAGAWPASPAFPQHRQPPGLQPMLGAAAAAATRTEGGTAKAPYHRMSSLGSVATTASGGRPPSEHGCGGESEGDESSGGRPVLSDLSTESDDVAEPAAWPQQHPPGLAPPGMPVCQPPPPERRARGCRGRGHGSGGRAEAKGSEPLLPPPPGLAAPVTSPATATVAAAGFCMPSPAARARGGGWSAAPQCMLATDPAPTAAMAAGGDAASRGAAPMISRGGAAVRSGACGVDAAARSLKRAAAPMGLSGLGVADTAAPTPLRAPSHCILAESPMAPKTPEAATPCTPVTVKSGRLGTDGTLLSTPAPAPQAPCPLPGTPAGTRGGGSTAAVAAATAPAPAPKEPAGGRTCGATAASGARAGPIFGTTPSPAGGQHAPRLLGHTRPPLLQAAAEASTGSLAAMRAAATLTKAPKEEGEAAAAVQKLVAEPPQVREWAGSQSGRAPPASWSGPLKVFISKYECEVPALDPEMPAKKRFPEWLL